MAAYGLLAGRRSRGEYQPMLPRPNSMQDALQNAPGPYDPYSNAPARRAPSAGGLLMQQAPRTSQLMANWQTLMPEHAGQPYHGLGATSRERIRQGYANEVLGPMRALAQSLESRQDSRTVGPNQTVDQKGLLYDPSTGRGHYNNALVNNGGLLTNAQAAGLHSQTGYMPNKTVGGKWGVQGSGVPLNPTYERPAGSPSSGDYFTDSRQGYGPYGPQFAAALGNRPVDQTPAKVHTQDDLDRLFGPGKYQIGPRGETMPTEMERSRRRNQAASPEGIARTEMLAGNRVAYQERRQGLLDQRQTNVTQNAMARGAARRGRLEARRAGPEPMGLLEQMAMRDPRNAAQLLAMRQQGLLAQQGLNLQQQQLQQQGQLGLLNADIRRQGVTAEGKRYDAEIARQGNRDGIERQKLALDYRAAAAAARQNGDYQGAANYERQAAELGGGTPAAPQGGLLTPNQQGPPAPGPVAATPKTPGPAQADPLASQGVTDPYEQQHLRSLSPPEQDEYLRRRGFTEQQRIAIIRSTSENQYYGVPFAQRPLDRLAPGGGKKPDRDYSNDPFGYAAGNQAPLYGSLPPPVGLLGQPTAQGLLDNPGDTREQARAKSRLRQRGYGR